LFLGIKMDSASVKAEFDQIKDKFGFNFHLKDEQVEVIRGILNGTDMFAVLPTGFGKSLTFMLPPILLDQVSFYVVCSM
jgi:superfamily II DNA helicase RecQ